jgi:hypothetical protein
MKTSEHSARYITLAEAARLIPGRRPGKAASINTVWRYCTRGLRDGIRLRSKMVGGHRCTTPEWVEEFIEELTHAAGPTSPPERQVRTPGQRQRASEKAARELNAEWLQGPS